MYWNSVSTFGANLQLQYQRCEEIVYFSRDFITAFIHYIHYTEVTANQLKSNRCFHCARLKSMYWHSVSTFVAQLQFQYHSCEEIVYFSRDFITIHSIYPTYRSHGEPAEFNTDAFIVQDWNRCTDIQYHFCGTSSISVPQLWRDSLLFKGF